MRGELLPPFAGVIELWGPGGKGGEKTGASVVFYALRGYLRKGSFLRNGKGENTPSFQAFEPLGTFFCVPFEWMAVPASERASKRPPPPSSPLINASPFAREQRTMTSRKPGEARPPPS